MGLFAGFGMKDNTSFIVKNIAQGNKTIRIFNYPILNGKTRDLLSIPGISEADIRESLLKGALAVKIKSNEAIIVNSDIDLMQHNDSQKTFLKNAGIINGLDLTSVSDVGGGGGNSVFYGGGGDGITANQHKSLRQLIHLADNNGPMEGFTSGVFRETLPLADPFPTSIIWWDSSSKLKKIVENIIVYDSNFNPTTITWAVYASDGTTLASISDIIVYSGIFETTRTRVING